ncbi:uncharacterized protein LOC132312421 isoform X2 [Cornus florida]|uniref:uncharacterized protein LOC132312421 isoform X2 n=1 Tax=Cornus florida TaxID=4283 RepID=UPI002896B6A2|nr:uncharacterized protein LOC132312421 isoform X2 [Cornus florida]
MADSASDANLGPRRRVPPHRPRGRLAPNQHLRSGKLWMSLMCDSCGNRMPKWSMISFILDDSILAQKRNHTLGLTWTKILHDCTNPNCLAEITIKRKGMEIVVESGATPYFRPEDEGILLLLELWLLALLLLQLLKMGSHKGKILVGWSTSPLIMAH